MRRLKGKHSGEKNDEESLEGGRDSRERRGLTTGLLVQNGEFSFIYLIAQLRQRKLSFEINHPELFLIQYFPL